MSMLQNFTLGQYVPGRSFVHRLDPRSKFGFLIVFAIAVFMANNIQTYSLLLASMLVAVFLSELKLSYIVKGLQPVWLFLLITAVFHLLFTKGGTVYFQYQWISVEEEGVRQATYMTLRIGLLMVASSLLTLTTTPIDLTDGLERMFHVFKKVGVPVHEIALMLSIALRFIPTLLEETDKIMKAQKARGADFESGNIIVRVKSVIPIVVPLFISAFRRAEELALAMEARGYRGGAGRTRLRQLQLTWRDSVMVVVTLLHAMLVGWWRT